MKIWVILLTLVFVGCSTAPPSTRKIAVASDPTEVLVSFVGAHFNLNGTLTYPGQSSAFRRSPAVLLIPGSGPTDRDGNQPGLTTDLLKQISTDLARKGIASLRFDKRSVNSYSNLWPKDPNALREFFSWENFVEDASQAYLILKNSKGIDPDQCSILGHSEGGLIASQIAASLNPPSLVLMATPGRPLGEVLQSQVQTLLAKQNASASVRAFYESEDVRIQKSIEESGIIPPDVPPGLQAIFPQSAAKYLQSVLQLQPEVKLMAYKGAVLVMNGLLDSQVNPKLDSEALFKSLSGRKNCVQKIELIPGLSHNFKSVQSSSDSGFSGQVPQSVTSEISDWLEANWVSAF